MPLVITDQNGNQYSLTVNSTDGSLVTAPIVPVTPSTGNNSITVTALAIINAAGQEIGALASGEQFSSYDQAWVLQKMQRLIDRYNARQPMVYNVNFSLFNLPSGPNPVTIGPGATFDVGQRPVSIPSIGLILAGTPSVEIPLNCRDQDWWANNRIKGLTSTLPTDYYYSPDWQNGGIYFWPEPTASYQVRVQSRLVLGQYTGYADSFTMPPAYWDLIVYELAISLCPGFHTSASSELIAGYKAANKAVQVNNISSPRLASDSPSQGSGSGCPDFNFLTGLSR